MRPAPQIDQRMPVPVQQVYSQENYQRPVIKSVPMGYQQHFPVPAQQLAHPQSQIYHSPQYTPVPPISYSQGPLPYPYPVVAGSVPGSQIQNPSSHLNTQYGQQSAGQGFNIQGHGGAIGTHHVGPQGQQYGDNVEQYETEGDQ